MVSLYETFFGTWTNWGEKTYHTEFSDLEDDKKWKNMSDSNIVSRDENVNVYNSKNCNSTIAQSINDIIENSVKSVLSDE